LHDRGDTNAASTVLLRTATPPVQSIPLLRRAVADTDRNAAAFHTVPLAEYTEVATFGQKVAANLMAALGLMCLLLAAVGLYSVMSYTVTQRIPEIGIRIAMGATPGNVIGMVVGQGMALAAAGVAVGTATSLATTRPVSSMLCGVNAADPLSFVLAGLFSRFGRTPRCVAAGLPRYSDRSDLGTETIKGSRTPPPAKHLLVIVLVIVAMVAIPVT
jgi:ABC-type antimicrobial peptide transport system permease subunit